VHIFGILCLCTLIRGSQPHSNIAPLYLRYTNSECWCSYWIAKVSWCNTVITFFHSHIHLSTIAHIQITSLEWCWLLYDSSSGLSTALSYCAAWILSRLGAQQARICPSKISSCEGRSCGLASGAATIEPVAGGGWSGTLTQRCSLKRWSWAVLECPIDTCLNTPFISKGPSKWCLGAMRLGTAHRVDGH
jgi:hypothetical protein